MQHCIVPRMPNSPSDALYCARFIQRIHKLGVPGGSLLIVLQQVGGGTLEVLQLRARKQ